MPDFGRGKILSYLKEEVVGPRTTGEKLDTSITNVFTEKGVAQGPWVDSQSGQEILYNLKPSDRYGAGVLHPRRDSLQTIENDEVLPEEDEEEIEFPAESDDLPPSDDVVADEEEIAGVDGEPELEQKDDARKPTSMGISFFATFTKESKINISVTGGWYSRFSVLDDSGKRQKQVDCYLRNQFSAVATLNGLQILKMNKKTLIELSLSSEIDSPVKLKLVAFIRPWENGEYLVTLSFLNVSADENFPKESLALFQTEICLSLSGSVFRPYPNIKPESKLIEGFTYQETARLDDESTELLFSDYPTIAIGHNCSVDWPMDVSEVNSITASCFPTFEAPSITPDIKYSDGSSVTLDMRMLSDSGRKLDAISSLERLVDEYEKWITREQNRFYKMVDFARFEEAFNANVL